MLNSYKNFYL